MIWLVLAISDKSDSECARVNLYLRMSFTLLLIHISERVQWKCAFAFTVYMLLFLAPTASGYNGMTLHTVRQRYNSAALQSPIKVWAMQRLIRSAAVFTPTLLGAHVHFIYSVMLRSQITHTKKKNNIFIVFDLETLKRATMRLWLRSLCLSITFCTSIHLCRGFPSLKVREWTSSRLCWLSKISLYFGELRISLTVSYCILSPALVRSLQAPQYVCALLRPSSQHMLVFGLPLCWQVSECEQIQCFSLVVQPIGRGVHSGLTTANSSLFCSSASQW